MSMVYTHALNYSQVESNLVDISIGFISEETFRNDNQQYYSPSTSSEMETMFTNFQHMPVKQEENDPFSQGIQYNGYSYESPNQMVYQTQQQNQGLPNDFDASFSAVNSLASENYDTQTNIDSSKNCSNLIRHKSSPAQFFSDYSLHNDGSFDITNGQATTSTTMNFQFNTPKTSTTSMDKFLHIQGSVPCKIRAKRGFATHPRSIAERERRIRISARIKKLQDLFPNSDKQTSTADMLDAAVDYIKDLRKKLKILSEYKAKCTCTRN